MLDISGLWVLHPTGLLVAGHANALFLGAVQVHMVAAGLLFACMVCRLDPVGRPWGPAWRGGTTGRRAAHAVLAKSCTPLPRPAPPSPAPTCTPARS
ncbi:cytochrome c oxidase assembly protein [Streptomyces zhihengii]|uniref:cytochrome c oxidase assembly protein n=1 Tax=Streptomyces zhihengii TaxID=1818004 RepID=UPI00362B6913